MLIFIAHKLIANAKNARLIFAFVILPFLAKLSRIA
jgi:hypothetical protein